MTEIQIPFNLWSLERLARGVKLCTSRRHKYGEPGDTFSIEPPMNTGNPKSKEFFTYELLGHVHLPLGFIFEHLWRLEGADNQEELEEVWRSIHPHAKINLDELFWVHFFRRLW